MKKKLIKILLDKIANTPVTNKAAIELEIQDAVEELTNLVEHYCKRQKEICANKFSDTDMIKGIVIKSTIINSELATEVKSE